MAEYNETLESAWGTFPMAAAMALWPACVERHGGEVSGPSAEVRAFMRAMA
jgi:hypothetical protein